MKPGNCMSVKFVIIFLPINLNMYFGCSKVLQSAQFYLFKVVVLADYEYFKSNIS